MHEVSTMCPKFRSDAQMKACSRSRVARPAASVCARQPAISDCAAYSRCASGECVRETCSASISDMASVRIRS